MYLLRISDNMYLVIIRSSGDCFRGRGGQQDRSVNGRLVGGVFCCPPLPVTNLSWQQQNEDLGSNNGCVHFDGVSLSYKHDLYPMDQLS